MLVKSFHDLPQEPTVWKRFRPYFEILNQRRLQAFFVKAFLTML